MKVGINIHTFYSKSVLKAASFVNAVVKRAPHLELLKYVYFSKTSEKIGFRLGAVRFMGLK